MTAAATVINSPGPTPSRQAELDQVKAALNGLLNNGLFINELGYLWGRWQDEGQYEDWTDYSTAMQKLLADHGNGLKFVKATKRPFGVQCTHELTGQRVFAVTVTSNSVSWKAIK